MERRWWCFHSHRCTVSPSCAASRRYVQSTAARPSFPRARRRVIGNPARGWITTCNSANNVATGITSRFHQLSRQDNTFPGLGLSCCCQDETPCGVVQPWSPVVDLLPTAWCPQVSITQHYRLTFLVAIWPRSYRLTSRRDATACNKAREICLLTREELFWLKQMI